MRLSALAFDKTALLQAPADEVALFLVLAHSTNEVNALLRMVLWTTDYSSPNEVVVHGQIALSYIVLRLLAGKLSEAHKTLRRAYFGTGLSKSFDPNLAPQARAALKSLNQYFGKVNILRDIRDKFSFHYDTAELSRALPLVDEALVAYLQEGGSTNNLYYVAEVIASTAAVTAASSSDIPQALASFTHDLLAVTRAFTVAADAIIAEFISRNPAVSQGPLSQVILPKLTSTLEVRLPWFSDPTDLGTGLTC